MPRPIWATVPVGQLGSGNTARAGATRTDPGNTSQISPALDVLVLCGLFPSCTRRRYAASSTCPVSTSVHFWFGFGYAAVDQAPCTYLTPPTL